MENDMDCSLDPHCTMVRIACEMQWGDVVEAQG